MKDSISVDRNADDQAGATPGDFGVDEKGGPPQFLPELLNRPIMIRMKDGRPIKGVLVAYNNYELLIDLGQGNRLIVFKGAVSSIDCEDRPQKGDEDRRRGSI